MVTFPLSDSKQRIKGRAMLSVITFFRIPDGHLFCLPDDFRRHLRHI
jgi:hypothetical protein